mgnify:CR=1 FL=1
MKLVIDDTLTYLTEVESKTTTLILEPFYTEDATSDNAIGMDIIIGNGVDEIAAGFVLFFEVKADITVDTVTLLANASGSIVIDLWKDSYANYPPTSEDSICATSKPTLSGAAKSMQTTFIGWDTTWAEGEIIGVNVDSATTVKQVTLAIRGTRTVS